MRVIKSSVKSGKRNGDWTVRLIFPVLLMVVQLAYGQNVTTVSGYVYDSIGKAPMADVNISVAGTGRGTTTNRNGFFRISLPASQTVLTFSYVGYRVQQLEVNRRTVAPVKIYLAPEIKMIGEVRIKPGRFRNILEGDSLQVLDYEIWKDRLLILARSVNDSLKQRIYLANLGGYIYSYRNLHDMGRMIKFPDEPARRKVFLFKDTYGEIQLLAKNRVWQIYLKDNSIYLLYPSKYEDCDQFLFPVKCRLGNKLFFQESNQNYNGTFFRIRDTDTVRRVKLIYDEFGQVRYLRQRSVVVPIITYNGQMALFNFIGNEIEFFNEQGRSVKRIPTMFHTKWYFDWRGKKAYDLDNINFTQDIIRDEATGKVYSVWRTALTGRFTLKELNMQTGEILAEIPIPEHRFIDKVLVQNNQVWFLHRDREEQKYKSLYTMYLN
jgi:hypothetical protein